MNLTAIVLTLNEEQHLDRCLTSLRGIASDVLVVDSFSTDSTKTIAEKHGARFLQRKWLNYADQFNWAVDQVPGDRWVFRIDADEYVTPELHAAIAKLEESDLAGMSGFEINRRMFFLGKPIRFGGVFPVKVVRIFRAADGRCENRWMDEHIIVSGPTARLSGELIDDNLNSLTWWTDKHNKYANREAVDVLNLEFGLIKMSSVARLDVSNQAGIKRWLKERIYVFLPSGFRSFLYFFYRYVVRFGFLDGKRGTAFHFLQGFWYRFLVDAKVDEVKRYSKRNSVSVKESVRVVLGIDLKSD